ncbi:MAG TPA: hypothetical protein PKV96_02715 [Candidatus Saccharimonas sp.]|nr:hypothetical protein [Candidatus Saccharimonas sp.]
MPIKVDDPTDIQSAYDDLGGTSLHKAETAGADGSHDQIPGYDRSADGLDDREGEFDASQAAGDAESNTSDSWANNFTEQSGQSSGNFKGVLKKAGPAGGIIGVIIALGSLVSFFGGPGLLLVHIAEIITEKTNLQLASLEKRKLHLLDAKLNNTTAGFCKGAVSVRCKFGTMSDANIRAFKNAGIEVVTDGKSVLGRNKVSHMFYTDGGEKVRVDAKDFGKMSRTNPIFSRMLITAYNGNFFGLQDKIMKKSLSKSKTSKANPFDGIEGEDEESNKSRMKRLIETTKNGLSFSRKSTVEQPKDCNAQCVEETKQKNAAINAENGILSDAEEVAKSNIKSVQPNGVKAALSLVNAFSVLDDVCMIPNLTAAIGTGAKVIRSQQEIRFAMIFLPLAGMIKTNDASPGNISFVASLLTKTVNYSNGTTSLPWDSSTAWKHVAYGDKFIGKDATPFLVGGGLGGELSGISSKVYGLVGGKKTCDIAGNVGTQATGMLVSFIPGAGQAVKAGSVAIKQAIIALLKNALKNVVKSAAEGAAFDYILGYLLAIATDMVAGVIVDENTIGDSAASALTIGGAEMLSQTAGMGGNGALSPAQAVAYNDLNTQVVAQYKDYERATKSPLDATSNATFIGSIYSSLMPFLSRSNSVSGALSSAGAIVTSTFSNILSPSKATALSADDYTLCEDYEYRELGVATSALCVVQRGIPTKYLDILPEKVNEELSAQGYISPDTLEPMPGTKYSEWVTACTAGAVIDSDACMYSGPDERLRALFSLHFVDMRVQDVLENGVVGADPEAAVGAGTAATGRDDVPAKWKEVAERNYQNTIAGRSHEAWLGMIPGQCAAWSAWKAAKIWYGSALAADGSNLAALVASKPMVPGHTLNFGNGGAVAGFLISSGVADRVGSLAETQAGDVISMRSGSQYGHTYTIVSNVGGLITIEDYNAAGGHDRYGTSTVTQSGYYKEASVIAIARVHAGGGQ